MQLLINDLRNITSGFSFFNLNSLEFNVLGSGFGNSTYFRKFTQNSSLYSTSLINSSTELASVFFNKTPEVRFFSNEFPELIYKIKIGNYLPGDHLSTNFAHMYTTLNKKAILGVKGDWFNSSDILASLQKDSTALLMSSNLSHSAKGNVPGPFENNKTAFLDLFTTTLNAKSSYSLTNTLSLNFLHDFQHIPTSLFMAQSKQYRLLND